MTIDEVCVKAGTTKTQYMEALSISEKGTHVVLERTPGEQNVNAYNPTVIKAWEANIDLQFIVDAYACVMYVASYMTKDENGMGELLKQACKEHADKDVKTMLRKVGSTFLNHREISAQEATYRILSMPMKKLSRSVVFVNTDPRNERIAVLKTKDQLENKHKDDEDIFQTSLVDRYIARPIVTENVCFADFAAKYVTRYTNKDDTDDSMPTVLEENDEQGQDPLPKQIKLRNGKGNMYRRRCDAVIRFRKFNVEKDPNKYYRSKLMLYLPWRNEEIDLISDFEDFKSHYDSVQNIVIENESKYSQNVDMVEQAMAVNNEIGPPEHIWAQLAPGTGSDNLNDMNEGINIETNMETVDLEANAQMFEMQTSNTSSDVIARYDIEERRDILAPAEYRKMMRCLNEKQREIVMFHRDWCKNAITTLKQNKKIQPYQVFLSGPGGVGKSHVIRLIQSDTKRIFSLSRQFKPTDITVLLTAPTGVAAFNIGGMTVHSALLLRTSKYSNCGDSLTFDKLNSVRSKLENLQLIIIDEVSMVGSDMLLNIHKRLCEIKGVSNDGPLFGNISVLAVGDLYQLPAVAQTQIYQPVRNPVANLSGSMWKDNFKLLELDEIMRQKDDKAFAELLCRVRLNECTPSDIAVLKSREISIDDPRYPHEALHVFAYNSDVDERNRSKLEYIAPNESDRILIEAIDGKRDSTGLVEMQILKTSQKRSDTGGLHTILELAIGARVMLVYNVDTSDGLVNGVIGEVQAVKKNSCDKIATVLVKFDNPDVGKHAILSSPWKQEFPNGVPIMRHEGKYEKAGKKGAQISRYQFPLTLAWAVTIHKCQGLTVDNIVVSMRGACRFGNGQAYVAFSRVKTLEGLYISSFDVKGIRTNKQLFQEMTEMRQNKIKFKHLPHLMTLCNKISIGHLNIHYFLDKIKDLQSKPVKDLMNKVDVMCFTETYLRREDIIIEFLNTHHYEHFSNTIDESTEQKGNHGLMICAASPFDPKEIETITTELESKTIVLTSTMSRLVVTLIYRPPSLPMNQFRVKLESLLNVLPLNVPTIILGDFNDNLIDTKESNITKLMMTHGLRQMVSKATTDSGSCLDHIYFNKDIECFIDIQDIYFSDHDATFITLKF